MNELIEIKFYTQRSNGTKIAGVNARELHSVLKVATKFADWISRRIDEYRFVEGVDFITILNNENSPPMKEYILKLDMAKELSMVERNEEGKIARQYFIDCENKLKQSTAPADPILAQIQIIQSMREAQIKLETKVEAGHIVLKEIVGNVKSLEDNMRIENWQQRNILDAIHEKAKEIIRLHPAVESKLLFPRMGRLFKQTFNIPRYNELPALKYEDAMVCICKMTVYSFPGLPR